jgi:hypothetical protein
VTLAEVERIISSGVPIYPQIFPRPVALIAEFDISAKPLTLCPAYRAVAGLPLAERVALLRLEKIAHKVNGGAPEDRRPLTQMAR